LNPDPIRIRIRNTTYKPILIILNTFLGYKKGKKV
jgi:hypothetical protein